MKKIKIAAQSRYLGIILTPSLLGTQDIKALRCVTESAKMGNLKCFVKESCMQLLRFKMRPTVIYAAKANLV